MMRQAGLILWFLFVTVIVILFQRYRKTLFTWISEIKKIQENKNQPIIEHPILKWTLRIFLILTLIAWLDFIIWSITSVFPLAIFILIIWGKKGLEESSHILILLAALWTASLMLFGYTPYNLIKTFDLEFLAKNYNVSVDVLKPLIIPLIALFFLGISSLIWKTKINWGIWALLISVCFPFILSFFFGGGINTALDWKIMLLSGFYKIEPQILKILLLPQTILIIAGIVLLIKKKVLPGLTWLIIGFLMPIAFVYIKMLYFSATSETGKDKFTELFQHFYGSFETFQILILIQICIIIVSFILALQKNTFKGIILFFTGLFLPLILIWVKEVFLPIMPKNLNQIASFYGITAEKFKPMIIPIILLSIIGIYVMISKKKAEWGILILLIGAFFPHIFNIVTKIFNQAKASGQDLESMSSYYKCSLETMKRLLLPMGLILIFGIIALFNKRAFWGGILIAIAIFLPFFYKPIIIISQKIYENKFYYSHILNYYQIPSSQLKLYLPAMVLMFLAGFLQLTMKNRITFGIMLIMLTIYLPLWWPDFFIILKAYF